MQQFKRKIAPVLLVLTAALGLLLTTAFAEGEAEYVSKASTPAHFHFCRR